jgi:hypothetical protein
LRTILRADSGDQAEESHRLVRFFGVRRNTSQNRPEARASRECAVGEGLSTFNAEKANPDLGIVEYGAEELFIRPQAFFWQVCAQLLPRK